MTRLVLAIFLIFSLAVTSAPATAAPSPDCPMATEHSSPGDHEAMGCCTPDCAITCVPAALQPADIHLSEMAASFFLATPLPAKSLSSLTPAIADPPPRISHS